MDLYRSDPHGEHRVALVEDCAKAGNRIYEIEDSTGSRLGFTGEELASLAQWWATEAKRPGWDEDSGWRPITVQLHRSSLN